MRFTSMQEGIRFLAKIRLEQAENEGTVDLSVGTVPTDTYRADIVIDGGRIDTVPKGGEDPIDGREVPIVVIEADP